jgi:hypothetical protein
MPKKASGETEEQGIEKQRRGAEEQRSLYKSREIRRFYSVYREAEEQRSRE